MGETATLIAKHIDAVQVLLHTQVLCVVLQDRQGQISIVTVPGCERDVMHALSTVAWDDFDSAIQTGLL